MKGAREYISVALPLAYKTPSSLYLLLPIYNRYKGDYINIGVQMPKALILAVFPLAFAFLLFRSFFFRWKFGNQAH